MKVLNDIVGVPWAQTDVQQRRSHTKTARYSKAFTFRAQCLLLHANNLVRKQVSKQRFTVTSRLSRNGPTCCRPLRRTGTDSQCQKARGVLEYTLRQGGEIVVGQVPVRDKTARNAEHDVSRVSQIVVRCPLQRDADNCRRCRVRPHSHKTCQRCARVAEYTIFAIIGKANISQATKPIVNDSHYCGGD